MQFDPGLEYKPPSVRRATTVNTQSAGVGGGGSNKDDNSWLLLCSALTDGPYSYIWATEKFSMCNVLLFVSAFIRKMIGKIYSILSPENLFNKQKCNQNEHFLWCVQGKWRYEWSNGQIFPVNSNTLHIVNWQTIGMRFSSLLPLSFCICFALI